MKKNTHLAIGVAVSTMFLLPKDVQSMAMCVCGSAIGSVISDVDVSTSRPRKILNKFISFSIAAIAVLITLELAFKIPIYHTIELQTNIYRLLLGYVSFLLLSVYGTMTKHRSYTHSIIGVLSFTGIVWIMLPSLVWPFCIGIISHILLDMLNYKKVRIFYPYKKGGIALKVCSADGKANTMLCVIGTLVVVVELTIFCLLQARDLLQ